VALLAQRLGLSPLDDEAYTQNIQVLASLVAQYVDKNQCLEIFNLMLHLATLTIYPDWNTKSQAAQIGKV